jgi:hypothetical protein
MTHWSLTQPGARNLCLTIQCKRTPCRAKGAQQTAYSAAALSSRRMASRAVPCPGPAARAGDDLCRGPTDTLDVATVPGVDASVGASYAATWARCTVISLPIRARRGTCSSRPARDGGDRVTTSAQLALWPGSARVGNGHHRRPATGGRRRLPGCRADMTGGPAQVNLRLVGPGAIAGIDPRQVIRTDPPAGAADFPPGRLPLVEFDRPITPGCSPRRAGERSPAPWLVWSSSSPAGVALVIDPSGVAGWPSRPPTRPLPAARAGGVVGLGACPTG